VEGGLARAHPLRTAGEQRWRRLAGIGGGGDQTLGRPEAVRVQIPREGAARAAGGRGAGPTEGTDGTRTRVDGRR
jgi:hypothetical protein